MRTGLLVLGLCMQTLASANLGDLEKRIKTIKDLNESQRSTATRFNRGGYRKDGLKIISNRTIDIDNEIFYLQSEVSEVLSQNSQLSQNLEFLKKESDEIKTENSGLKADLEQLERESELLEERIRILKAQLADVGTSKNHTCFVEAFGRKFMGQSKVSEEVATQIARAKCSEEFHQVQCQHTATCH